MYTKEELGEMSYKELQVAAKKVEKKYGVNINQKGKKTVVARRILKAIEVGASKGEPESVPEAKPQPKKAKKGKKAKGTLYYSEKGFEALGTNFKLKAGETIDWDGPETHAIKTGLETGRIKKV